jgi:hypothetical protein
MIRRRPFHYNIRRRNTRRSGIVPLSVGVVVLALAGVALLPDHIERMVALQADPANRDLHYESWTPPGPRSRAANDEDLAQLQAWLDETDRKLYAGTFPKVRITWADDYGTAYAYALGDQIRFVRSKFYPGWPGNRDVVLHEMAHVAMAGGHGHDILWDQERGRLAEGRRVMTLDQVRAASR